MTYGQAQTIFFSSTQHISSQLDNSAGNLNSLAAGPSQLINCVVSLELLEAGALSSDTIAQRLSCNTVSMRGRKQRTFVERSDVRHRAWTWIGAKTT